MHPTIPPTTLHRHALVTELLQAVAGSTRQRTEESIRNASFRVVLLCAHAGYGKTTLLADFARHSSLPCCWYFFDASDENPVAFLQRLIASIRLSFPNFGASLDISLTHIAEIESAQKLRYLELFVENLTKAISVEISERFALLLCDYHEIDAQQTTGALINRFIENMPPQCTLFLESRSTPNLDFTSLLARRNILEIGTSKLRFSAQEIHELARLQHINLTEQEAVHLEQSFEGWITGILLGTRLGNIQILIPLRADRATPGMQPERERLFDYLVKHVFKHQSDAYHFLQETAVLRQMTPALCNALLNISDAASRLAYLAKQGLFVMYNQSSQESIFVCHPILRELLYDEMQSQAPQRLIELHLRAVEIFRGRQDTEAIAHALAAQDFATAGQLIETVATQEFAKGNLTTLARWIDSLPIEITSVRPRLLLIRATIFLEESTFSKAQELLEQAIAALPAAQDTHSLHAEILLARAKLLIQQGDYSQARDLSRQTLQMVAIDEIELRATAHQILGTCAAFFSNFNASIAELQQALQLYGHDTQTRQVAKLHTLLANIYGMTAHNSLSEHHRTRAIQCWENLNDEWGRIDDLIGLGAIKGRQGATDEAVQIFMQALALSRGAIRYTCGEAYALANLGDLYQDQDQFQQALVAYEDSLAQARQIDEFYLVHYIICQLAGTHLLMGDPDGAQSIMTQFGQSIPAFEETSSYEQAVYAFTYGKLLLQTGHFDQAYDSLTAAESAFAETKYDYIQVMIYRAACLLAQGDTQAALGRTKYALQLAEERGYEEMVQRELKRCPHLLCYVKANAPALIQKLHMARRTAGKNGVTTSRVALPVAASQNLPILSIQALGAPAVYRDGALLKHWRMAKSMELFFLLCDASRPLHKERIIADLWPEETEPVDQTWRSTLHYLRKVLGTACIQVHRGIYRLQLETTYVVKYDVEDFQRFSAQAQEAQDIGDHETARQFFEKMIALYQGDFVTSFYSDWCAPRRDELRQMCINAHRQLALLSWKEQLLDKSLFHWQHILAMDNMAEAAYEGLIRCYIQQGKRNLALRHYNHYAALLHDELGVLPGETLQSLYQYILNSS